MKKGIVAILICCTIVLAWPLLSMKRSSREASPEKFDLPINITLPRPLLIDSETPAPQMVIALNPAAQDPLSGTPFSEILNEQHGVLLAVVLHLDTDNHMVYRVYDGTMLTRYLQAPTSNHRDPTSRQHILHVLYYLSPSASEPLTPIGDETQPGLVDALEAVSGDAVAMERLGNLYLSNTPGITKNPQLALAWLKKSAAQNNPSAVYNLGILLSEGAPGIRQDQSKAVEWLKKAAEQGYVPAMNIIGHIYAEGFLDIEKDYETARAWFQKSIAQNDPRAMIELGLLYMEPLEGTEGPHDALALYKQAKALNYDPQDEDQKKRLDLLIDKLTAAGMFKESQ